MQPVGYKSCVFHRHAPDSVKVVNCVVSSGLTSKRTPPKQSPPAKPPAEVRVSFASCVSESSKIS